MCDQEIYSKFNAIIARKERPEVLSISKNFEKFNKILAYCLASLDFEYKRILQLSYLEKKYKYWWLSMYSKSAFYRKRIRAIRSFVLLFETLYEIFDDSSVNSCNSIL